MMNTSARDTTCPNKLIDIFRMPMSSILRALRRFISNAALRNDNTPCAIYANFIDRDTMVAITIKETVIKCNRYPAVIMPNKAQFETTSAVGFAEQMQTGRVSNGYIQTSPPRPIWRSEQTDQPSVNMLSTKRLRITNLTKYVTIPRQAPSSNSFLVGLAATVNHGAKPNVSRRIKTTGPSRNLPRPRVPPDQDLGLQKC
jgi:hypothetical protein